MSSFVPHVPRSVKNFCFLVDYAVCSGAHWKLAPACDECHDWSISVKNFALSSLLIFTPVHDCVKELVYSFLYPSAPGFFFLFPLGLGNPYFGFVLQSSSDSKNFQNYMIFRFIQNSCLMLSMNWFSYICQPHQQQLYYCWQFGSIIASFWVRFYEISRILSNHCGPSQDFEAKVCIFSPFLTLVDSRSGPPSVGSWMGTM
jgi:hypothetical protein